MYYQMMNKDFDNEIGYVSLFPFFFVLSEICSCVSPSDFLSSLLFNAVAQPPSIVIEQTKSRE